MSDFDKYVKKVTNEEVKKRKLMTLGEFKRLINSINAPDETQIFIYMDEQSSEVRGVKTYQTGAEMVEENYNKAEWYDVDENAMSVMIEGNSF